MKKSVFGASAVAAAVASMCWVSAASADPVFNWQTVVNNGDTVPTTSKNFNSYNQPSINDAGLVVFRGALAGRARGQGPATGIFTRDMVTPGNPIVPVATRGDDDSRPPTPSPTPGRRHLTNSHPSRGSMPSPAPWPSVGSRRRLW